MPVKLKIRLTHPLMLQHNLTGVSKHDTLPCCRPHCPPAPGTNVAEAEAAAAMRTGPLLPGMPLYITPGSAPSSSLPEPF